LPRRNARQAQRELRIGAPTALPATLGLQWLMDHCERRPWPENFAECVVAAE
jgi:hypothetical protein